MTTYLAFQSETRVVNSDKIFNDIDMLAGTPVPLVDEDGVSHGHVFSEAGLGGFKDAGGATSFAGAAAWLDNATAIADAGTVTSSVYSIGYMLLSGFTPGEQIWIEFVSSSPVAGRGLYLMIDSEEVFQSNAVADNSTDVMRFDVVTADACRG